MDFRTFYVVCAAGIRCEITVPFYFSALTGEKSVVGVFQNGCGASATIPPDVPSWISTQAEPYKKAYKYQWREPFTKADEFFLCYCNTNNVPCGDSRNVQNNFVFQLGHLQIKGKLISTDYV